MGLIGRSSIPMQIRALVEVLVPRNFKLQRGSTAAQTHKASNLRQFAASRTQLSRLRDCKRGSCDLINSALHQPQNLTDSP